MSNTSSTTVIIAVPGGQETQELSLESAQEAFARGEIEPTRWAWCRTHQNWKPISELPEFQFTPTPAPAPAPVAQSAPVAQTTPAMQNRTAATAATPAIKAQARPVVQTVLRAKTAKDFVVKEAPTLSSFKIFVLVLALLVGGVAGANYLLVDKPLNDNLLKTSFATTPVYAHLAAFCQPDTIIIHLRPSTNINSTSMANYLVSLAQSTPTQPFNHQPFSTVGLTSAWTSQLLMSGNDWQTLAGMADASDNQKKDFILTHIGYPTGQRLMSSTSNMPPDVARDRRNQNWQALTSILVESATKPQIPSAPPSDS